MKRIAYTDKSGALFIVTPAEGARLCRKLTLADGRVLQSAAPAPVDSLARGWPIPGAVADWAETEDSFVDRIRSTDVPATALEVQIVDEVSLPKDRANRNAWKLNGQSIEVDSAKVADIFNALAMASVDGMDRLQFEHLYELENRMRALEGKAQIKLEQYRTALINRWKTLNPQP